MRLPAIINRRYQSCSEQGMKNKDKYAGLSKSERILVKAGYVSMWAMILSEALDICLLDHVPGWKAVILALIAVMIYADIKWMNSISFEKKVVEAPVSPALDMSYQADIDAATREAETGSLKGLFD